MQIRKRIFKFLKLAVFFSLVKKSEKIDIIIQFFLNILENKNPQLKAVWR
jgi:hypothetical protein